MRSIVSLVYWVGLALLAGSGCSPRGGAATADEVHSPPAANATPVTAGKPTRKNLLRSTTQPGRIEAFEQTPLYPKVAGYVKEVLGDIGDSVKKGQILVRLWIPELQDELEQKEALVAQSDAEVKQAESIIAAAKAAIDTAQARITEAEAGIGRATSDCDRCRSEYARIKELSARGSVTAKLEEEMLNQLRAAEAAQQEAHAKVLSVKAAFSEAQANVRKTEADLTAAQAQVRVAKANLARTKTMLGYTEMKAPFDGVITRRSVDTGHYISSAHDNGNTPLMVVARIDQVRLFVDVPEMEAALVDAGDPAHVRVQAVGLPDIDASVTRTSWSLYESNRSLRAEIDVPNAKQQLRPGMYAMVTIDLDHRENAITLPVAAVVRVGNASYCCRVNAAKIERQPVQLGLRSGTDIEIVSGIGADDIVVLKQAEALQHGQSVSVISTAK